MSQKDTENTTEETTPEEAEEITDEIGEESEDTENAIENEEELDETGTVDVDEAELPKEVEIPEFRAGDTVRILYKIIEGNKTRIQPFEGIVISKKGKDKSKTFTVRRIGADNVGVERIFPLYSPNITDLKVVRRGKVRRAKLYYLRDKKGRAAVRVKERKAKK